jgi:hypothetical protein
MSGEVTNQEIDLATTEPGMFFRIRTDRHYVVSVFPTAAAGPITDCEGTEFALGCAVMGLERVNEHFKTLITRTITRGTELRVKTTDGVIDHRLGKISLIVQGNC